MRKATVIMFIILILTLGGSCLAAVNIYDSRDEVTLTEMTTWGNKDSIRDLTMQMHIMYLDRLHWKTTVPMRNPEEAVTEYESSLTPIYADLDRDNGLSMDLSIDTSLVHDKIWQGNADGIAKAYEELANTIASEDRIEECIEDIGYEEYLAEIEKELTEEQRGILQSIWERLEEWQ